jgi:hypothetical protein
MPKKPQVYRLMDALKSDTRSLAWKAENMGMYQDGALLARVYDIAAECYRLAQVASNLAAALRLLPRCPLYGHQCGAGCPHEECAAEVAECPPPAA